MGGLALPEALELLVGPGAGLGGLGVLLPGLGQEPAKQNTLFPFGVVIFV